MKLKALLTVTSLKKRLAQVLVMAVLFVSPLVGICQVPGPGGPPETPVPFDDNMNLVFLTAGVVFALIVSVRYFRKKATTTA